MEKIKTLSTQVPSIFSKGYGIIKNPLKQKKKIQKPTKHSVKHLKKNQAILAKCQKRQEQEQIQQELETELNCPICLELIVNANNAACGHSFCEYCISEALLVKPNCPLCRDSIRQTNITKCRVVDGVIDKYLKTVKDQTFIKNYKERLQQNEEWSKNRKLTIFNIGSDIDVRDTMYIWCKATVQALRTNQHNQQEVFVHYHGWNNKYDEWIACESNRLAPLNFYSNRKDIPKYVMIPTDYNNNQNYIVQNSQEQERLIQQLNQNQNQNQIDNQDNNDEESEVEIQLNSDLSEPNDVYNVEELRQDDLIQQFDINQFLDSINEYIGNYNDIEQMEHLDEIHTPIIERLNNYQNINYLGQFDFIESDYQNSEQEEENQNNLQQEI